MAPVSPGQIIRVADREAASRLAAILLSRRDLPSIVLTADQGEPSLPPERVRALLGDAARVYLVEGDQLLAYLRTRLGAQLALARGMTRIYWPNLSVQSDPLDHPLVPTLADEPIESTLVELARQFDLSRPRVREHLKLVEDHRSVLQAQLATREKELRSTRSELTRITTRLNEITANSERQGGSQPGTAQ